MTLPTLLLLAAAGAAGFAAAALRRIIAVGSAYKAKVLCTSVFGTGLDLDPATAPEVNSEAYAILKLFRARIDREARTVTGSFGGLLPRTAVHRPGLGATLKYSSLAAVPVAPPPGAKPAAPVAAASPKLERALDLAFAEPNPRKPRRTRAVAIWRDGALVAERYAPGLTTASPLIGWSMTKSVFSSLVGLAVHDGKLKLSDRALLPEWTDKRREISLEDLLRMRSGLRFQERYEYPLSDVVQMLYAHGDMAAFAASRPLEDEPGTTWQYASGTSNILSLILRRRLGDPEYHSFPRRRLFEPLGMDTAYIEPDAAGLFVASSYMIACARDWISFGRLFLEDGVRDGRRLLPEGWARFCAAPTPQSRDLCYGAHWWLKVPAIFGGEGPHAGAVPADAYHAFGHEGQCLTIIPSKGIVALRMGLSIQLDAWDHAGFLKTVLES